jgi:transposase-like protein
MGKATQEAKKLALELLWQGLRTKAIVARAGVSPVTVYRIKRCEYLTDKKHGRRMPPAFKQQIIEYLKGPGKDLTVQKIADHFGVGSGTVSRCKSGVYAQAPDSEAKAALREKQRRKNISLRYRRKRELLYVRLCLLRMKMEAEHSPVPRRICQVCGEEWFKSKPFYNRMFVKKKDGSSYFHTFCVVCEGEMAFLKRTAGKTPAEIRQVMSNVYESSAEKTPGQLEGQMQHDWRLNCRDLMVPCRHCHRNWFWNGRYFMAYGRSDSRVIIDICLACPKRRFLSK